MSYLKYIHPPNAAEELFNKKLQLQRHMDRLIRMNGTSGISRADEFNEELKRINVSYYLSAANEIIQKLNECALENKQKHMYCYQYELIMRNTYLFLNKKAYLNDIIIFVNTIPLIFDGKNLREDDFKNDDVGMFLLGYLRSIGDSISEDFNRINFDD